MSLVSACKGSLHVLQFLLKVQKNTHVTLSGKCKLSTGVMKVCLFADLAALTNNSSHLHPKAASECSLRQRQIDRWMATIVLCFKKKKEFK